MLLNKITSILISTALLVTLVTTAQKNLKLSLDSMTCHSDTENLVVKECELNSSIKYINMVVLARTPIKKAIVHFVGKQINGGNSRKLLDIKSNMCAFLKNKRNFPLWRIAFEKFGFDNFSNINHPCPFEGEIYFKNECYDENVALMMGLIKGKYHANFTWLLNDIYELQVTVLFSMK